MEMLEELYALRRRLKLQLSCLKRRIVKPRLPKNSDGKVLAHIRCGTTNSPGLINIDARPLAHLHIVKGEITSLAYFGNGIVDLVYMCHVLEHIKRGDLTKVLLEMKKVLKDRGVLKISVADFDKMIGLYNVSAKDINAIYNQLMGGQDHEYNIDYSVFNHRRLSELLKEVGFRKVATWNPDNCQYHDFKDRATRRMKVDGKEIMISLNLEAIK